MTPIRLSIRGNANSSSGRHKLSKLRALGFYLFTSIVFFYTSFLLQLIYRYHDSSASTHDSNGNKSNNKHNDITLYQHAVLEQKHHDSTSNVLYEHYNNNDDKKYTYAHTKRVTRKRFQQAWTIPKQLLRYKSMESWYRTERAKLKQEIQARNLQRRQRTQQHPLHDGDLKYTVTAGPNPQGEKDASTPYLPSDRMPYILCPAANNSTYSSAFAINSRSTVVITGIFSNSIGVNLALYLYTHCGVTNIIGIDPLLPNTQTYRVRITSGPQALLTKIIPNFIFHKPHMGVQTSATASRDDEEEAAEKGSSYYNIVERYAPTHIVHLSSINSQYVYTRNSAGGPDEKPIIDNVDIPYDASIFQKKAHSSKEDEEASSWWSAYGPSRPINMLRQNRFAMEHILKSISQVQWKQQLMDLHSSGTTNTASHLDGRHDQPTVGKLSLPRFVYISSNMDSNDYSPVGRIQAVLPEVQDSLASAYAFMHDVSSVGLRVGTVYGPWDHFLTPMYQMADRAIKTLGSSIPPMIQNDNDQLTLMHADDVVTAIVSAMQLDISKVAFKPSQHVVFQLDTGERRSIRNISALLGDFFSRGSNTITSESTNSNNILTSTSTTDQMTLLPTWKPRTLLSQGIPKLLAWHYERAYKFGQNPLKLPSNSTAEEAFEQVVRDTGSMLLHSDISTCSTADVYCLRGLVTSRFPCSSECALSQSLCTRSMFDTVLDTIRESTQGCQSVLYTIALELNTDSIPHRLGPKDPHFDGYKVCNIVFIARRSPLAKKIVKSIPVEDKIINGTTVSAPSQGLSEAEMEDRLNLYNCKVETDGWTTCWVPTDATETSVSNEISMLKLSPGRFFAPSVKYSMFVDAAFPVLPTQDDVEFLLSQVYRQAQPERLVTYRLKNTEPDEGSRKASSGAPQIVYKYKIPPKHARRAILFVSPLRIFDVDPTKLSMRSASKLMLEEIGQLEESDYLKQQRLFYEGLPSKINKDEQRSMYEPLHKYSHSPFYIRSKWVIHDMTLEESRQLRCSWFQEHTFWGSELDSFSLAAVLARRDIERRIKWNEPDQRTLVSTPEIPEKLTDDNDWKMVWTDDSRFLTSKTKDRVASMSERAGLYVRIISDEEMLSARKQWVSRNEGASRK